jgi:hypothetical protein
MLIPLAKFPLIRVDYGSSPDFDSSSHTGGGDQAVSLVCIHRNITRSRQHENPLQKHRTYRRHDYRLVGFVGWHCRCSYHGWSYRNEGAGNQASRSVSGINRALRGDSNECQICCTRRRNDRTVCCQSAPCSIRSQPRARQGVTSCHDHLHALALTVSALLAARVIGGSALPDRFAFPAAINVVLYSFRGRSGIYSRGGLVAVKGAWLSTEIAAS